MVTAPCRGCPDRHLGCHGICEKYQDYLKKHAEELAAQQPSKDAYIDLYSYREEKARRLK